MCPERDPKGRPAIPVLDTFACPHPPPPAGPTKIGVGGSKSVKFGTGFRVSAHAPVDASGDPSVPVPFPSRREWKVSGRDVEAARMSGNLPGCSRSIPGHPGRRSSPNVLQRKKCPDFSSAGFEMKRGGIPRGPFAKGLSESLLKGFQEI